MFMARHGDVLIVPLSVAQKRRPWLKDKYEPNEEINGTRVTPAEVDADGNVILAKGEKTGHNHAVMNNGVIVSAVAVGDVVQFETNGETTTEHIGYVGHRDHRDIKLPPGSWVKLPQRRYDRMLNERPVLD